MSHSMCTLALMSHSFKSRNPSWLKSHFVNESYVHSSLHRDSSHFTHESFYVHSSLRLSHRIPRETGGTFGSHRQAQNTQSTHIHTYIHTYQGDSDGGGGAQIITTIIIIIIGFYNCDILCWRPTHTRARTHTLPFTQSFSCVHTHSPIKYVDVYLYVRISPVYVCTADAQEIHTQTYTNTYTHNTRHEWRFIVTS